MKNIWKFYMVSALLVLSTACTNTAGPAENTTVKGAALGAGQSAVADGESQKTVLQIAISSKDHTTLVAAVQAAKYEDVLANAGPFTVFAPTDEAFSKVDKETLNNLLKPENKAALQNVLEYHVSIGGYPVERLADGQKINQANMKNIIISKKDGKLLVNGVANIIASVPASNGIVHVIDAVLLPPE